MTVLLNSEIFILTLVIGVYLAAVWLFRKTRLSILNPLLVSIPVLALITHFLGISYESFEKGSRIISFMLGPTVVVLGYLLYEQIAQCCFYHYFGICRLYNRGIERDFYCPVFRCRSCFDRFVRAEVCDYSDRDEYC